MCENKQQDITVETYRCSTAKGNGLKFFASFAKCKDNLSIKDKRKGGQGRPFLHLPF
jgi:hypothetical protein